MSRNLSGRRHRYAPMRQALFGAEIERLILELRNM
jgi:hypothetical protein